MIYAVRDPYEPCYTEVAKASGFRCECLWFYTETVLGNVRGNMRIFYLEERTLWHQA